MVQELDMSYNPLLTGTFYTALDEINTLKSTGIKKLSLEGNKMGDKLIGRLVKSLIQGGRIVELNLSKNEISDYGARFIALILYECHTLHTLLIHYNRILGRGGAEIARAIKHTNELHVLDISYNTIGGGTHKKVQYPGQNNRKIECEEEFEDPIKQRTLELLKDDEYFEEPEDSLQWKQSEEWPLLPTHIDKKDKRRFKGVVWADFWKEMFVENTSLVHVDFSHNNL